MKKNVWIWNHYATNTFYDRGGRHYWFAKYLKKAGYNPVIFCASTVHNSQHAIDTHGKKYIEDSVDGIPYVFVKTPPYQGNGRQRIKNMLVFYRNLFPVSKAYAQTHESPDIILASSVHPLTLIVGIKIARKFNIPCICEIRDLWPEAIFMFGKASENSLLGKLLLIGEHWIYRKADALIFTKEGDADYLIEKRWTSKQGGDINLEKCYYINNGVDLSVYERQIETEKFNDSSFYANKFNVVYTGAIRSVNNVGNILDSAKLLLDYPKIQFLIYGEGDQVKELQKRIADEKINNVIFKGLIPKKNIPYVLSQSSVNILNYSQNNYNWKRGNSSNKLFEYMASGKPIISTVKTGYSIILKYSCGLELSESIPQSLAENILKIYEMSPEQRNSMGQNAQEGVKDFNFSRLTDKLIAIIDKIS